MRATVKPPLWPSSSRTLALALVVAAGCVPRAEPVELDVEPGDLIVVATAADGADGPVLRQASAIVARDATFARAFASADGAPFFVFRIRAADVVGATAPVTEDALSKVRARLASEPRDERCPARCARERTDCERTCGGDTTCRAACAATEPACVTSCAATMTGDCGRCLVPTSTPPLVVSDGDACTLPAFVEGRLYQLEDGRYVARASDDNARAVAAARSAIRLEWPGACACGDVEAAPSIAGLEVEPISPASARWPLSQVAETSDGLVVGASDRVAITFDPRTGRASAPTDLGDYPIEVRSMAGLADGDLLVSGETYSETLMDGYRFDRLAVDRAADPPRVTMRTPLSLSIPARPQLMKYVGEGPASPLWLVGSASGQFGLLEPAMFACEPDGSRCQPVSVTSCAGDVYGLILRDVVTLPNGTGVGISDRALYYKAAGSGGLVPAPSDPWTCHSDLPPVPWRADAGGGEDSVSMRTYRAIARLGDRVFLCGLRTPPRCEASYPVVLTATVGAALGEAPTPEWVAIAREADWADCQRFLPVPGDPTKVRALFSNGRTIELDADGNVGARGQIGELFGPSTLPWSEIRALPSGSLVARTRENGLYWSDGTSRFVQLYGGAYERASYSRIVSTPQGFFAFGHPTGIVRVDASHTGDQPSGVMGFVEDRVGGLVAGDRVRGAVVDSSTIDGDGFDLVVTGYRDTSPVTPLVRRLRIEAKTATVSRIASAVDVEVPEALVGLAVDGITETSRGRFAAIVQDTRIITIEGDVATEIELDFDAPETEAIELKPRNQPSDCGGGTARLDAWRAIDGENGVAWAVGQQGLVMRIAGGKAQRFILNVEETPGMPKPVTDADVAIVRATCADRVLLAGRYDRLQGMGGRTLSVWSVVPKAAPAGTCLPAAAPVIPPGDGEVLETRELAETECLRIPHTVGQLVYGYPRAFLSDGTGTAIALENGYLHRFGSNRLERLRVPFSVSSVAQDADGAILFGAGDARLAVGIAP
ncbi:hypothetical protein L6R52_02400 [Myxococcota bacterium]|nr:hypothetical protein [Myxococcota bacterium]